MFKYSTCTEKHIPKREFGIRQLQINDHIKIILLYYTNL